MLCQLSIWTNHYLAAEPPRERPVSRGAGHNAIQADGQGSQAAKRPCMCVKWGYLGQDSQLGIPTWLSILSSAPTKSRATTNPAQGWINSEGKRTASITTWDAGGQGAWNRAGPIPPPPPLSFAATPTRRASLGLVSTGNMELLSSAEKKLYLSLSVCVHVSNATLTNLMLV